MCIVFYRVSKSDLWSYMVNTDLLPATPSSSWLLSCVVFLVGGNQQIKQIVLIFSDWGKATKASCQYFEKVMRKRRIIIRWRNVGNRPEELENMIIETENESVVKVSLLIYCRFQFKMISFHLPLPNLSISMISSISLPSTTLPFPTSTTLLQQT